MGMNPVISILALMFLASGIRGTAAEEVSTLLIDPKDPQRDRVVPIKVYHAPGGNPLPVILFSHGLGGSREGNPYLGNHWAKNGYVVVFLQHKGSDRGVWENAPRNERMTALRGATGLKPTLDRFQDIPFIIDQLELWNSTEGHALFGKLDLDHIGLSGHSYGAVTTLGLTGRKFRTRQTFGDERIDAFPPLSPQPGRGSASHSFGHLDMPILCMTGTEDGSPLDSSFDPAVRKEVYAAFPSSGNKYQLVFEGAHHFAFADSQGWRAKQRNAKHHPAIQLISTRFWDAYLKNDADAKGWLQSGQVRQDCDLDPKDTWEWK